MAYLADTAIRCGFLNRQIAFVVGDCPGCAVCIGDARLDHSIIRRAVQVVTLPAGHIGWLALYGEMGTHVEELRIDNLCTVVVTVGARLVRIDSRGKTGQQPE